MKLRVSIRRNRAMTLLEAVVTLRTFNPLPIKLPWIRAIRGSFKA
jgi:hypothetical protein